MHAVVIGGTGFVGRHTVVELVENGYAVTTVARSVDGHCFGDADSIEHVQADRRDPDALREVARQTDPDLVVDCAAYHPGEVLDATEIFADVETYVYVSSGAVYDGQEIPKREDETPLQDCTPEQAEDDSMATYGPRKAECDREVVEAADRGVRAVSVRPTVVYGPKTVQSLAEEGVSAGASASSWSEDVPNLQTRHDYWIDRVRRFDRVVVPGDGTAIWHRAYVEDVASAIRTVAERGTAGKAYNVGDRRVCTLEDVIDLVAAALNTTVTVVHASDRDLDRFDLDPDDFPLYHHSGSRYPHVLETCNLASLGWESTSVAEAMDRTVAESTASGRDGSAFDPGRESEERLLDAFET